MMESSSRSPAARNASLSADIGSLLAGAAVLTAWLGQDRRRTRRAGGRRGGVRARRIAAVAARLVLALLGVLLVLGAWGVKWATLQLASVWRSGARRVARETPALATAAVAAPNQGASVGDDEVARRASWIEAESLTLPDSARPLLRTMAQRVREMALPMRDLPEHASESGELRRLLHDELPELLRAYRRVPRHLAPDATLHVAPEEQLRSGLAIIDAQLVDLQRRFASEELRALTTQLRYLTLKYGSGPELSERSQAARVSSASD